MKNKYIEDKERQGDYKGVNIKDYEKKIYRNVYKKY